MKPLDKDIVDPPLTLDLTTIFEPSEWECELFARSRHPRREAKDALQPIPLRLDDCRVLGAGLPEPAARTDLRPDHPRGLHLSADRRADVHVAGVPAPRTADRPDHLHHAYFTRLRCRFSLTARPSCASINAEVPVPRPGPGTVRFLRGRAADSSPRS